MLSTIAMINFIENVKGKNDNFLLNYLRNQQKRKTKRFLLLEKKIRQKRKLVSEIHCIQKVNRYQPNVYHSEFRMLHSTYEILQNSLKPFWTRKICCRLGYSLEKCLSVTLWMLCDGDVTFQELSDRFNIAKGNVHNIFYKTVELICFLKNEIMWPSVSQQKITMEHFQKSTHNAFPFVIGCVAGTDFNICMPIQDAASYCNRKGNYTVKMQAICDNKFRFLDVFIGCPGSYLDSYVWKISPIFKSITSSQVEVADNGFIIGGSAYPLSKFLMTPYSDNSRLTCAEKHFNNYLSSTTVSIEQAYRMLKKNFKILRFINLGSVEKASKVIYACTILHNFIINRENISECNTVITDDTNSTDESPMNVSYNTEGNEDDMDGLKTRKRLTELFP